MLYVGHDQNLVCNTDWMGLSIRLDEGIGEAPAGHKWVVYDNGTNVWADRRILYTDRGDKVCTLLSRPKSQKFLDPQAALLEIENEWLYHGIGVEGIIDKLWENTPFNIVGMSRCDLCIDFNPTFMQWQTIKKLATGEIYVGGKRNGSGFWSICQDDYIPPALRGKRIPHCISWGHKTSNVRWKLYYKTKELKDAVNGMGWDKPYIVDQWRIAELDENNVWRLEVAIHKCNSLDVEQNLEYDDNERHKMTFKEWKLHRWDILTQMYTSRFICRENQGHADKSNDDIVRFLPIDGTRRITCRKPAGETSHFGRITLLRHLVQSLDDDAVLLDDESREDVLWHIGEIIRRDGLQKYFTTMVNQEYDDWVEAMRVKACDTEGYTGEVARPDTIVNTDIKPNTQQDVQM